MEHIESRTIKLFIALLSYFSRCTIVLLLIFSVLGCKSEDPNPELKDPIYQDLLGKAEAKQKEVNDAEKNLESLVKALEVEEIRTLGIKLARNKVKEAKDKLAILKQQSHYLKIRAEHRKLVGRKAYRIAFNNGEVWPDPNEFKKYEINKKLREADLNWNKRVPKLNHANPNFSAKE